VTGGPAEDPERLEARVFGRVQGVGFRAWTVKVASRLGLVGWVANESGGTVRVVAEGPPADLGQLLSMLRRGPMSGEVTNVTATRGPATGTFVDFSVRSGWHPGD
jgi:acylphosphatase